MTIGQIAKFVFCALIVPSSVLVAFTPTAQAVSKECEAIWFIGSMVEKYASWTRTARDSREENYVTFMLDDDPHRVLIVEEEESMSDRHYISSQLRTSFDLRDIGSVQLANGELKFSCRGETKCVSQYFESHQYPSQRGTVRLGFATIKFRPGTVRHQAATKRAFLSVFGLRGIKIVDATGQLNR